MFQVSSEVERLAVNQNVAGSIPALGAKIKWLYPVDHLMVIPDCHSGFGGFDSRTGCQFYIGVS